MKAAIYSRKSKFKEEGESIKNQIDMCIKYAEYNLGITEYEIYQDEGFSGGNTDRPQFKKLIKDIKDKKFTHLICYRLDRISRNVSDFSSTLDLLDKYNVAFVSIKEQFDTSSAMGRAMMNISATFAQLERETIAERISDNLRELSKTGRWLGGPAPMGYKSIEVENTDGQGKNRKKHILEFKDDEIDKIKVVFSLFKKYQSYQKVSNILEDNKMFSRSGSVFSRSLVKKTLRNPIYAIADDYVLDYYRELGSNVYVPITPNGTYALMPYNRRTTNGCFTTPDKWTISVGEHPGVISGKEFVEIQKIMDGIENKAKANRTGTSKTSLLSGLVVCSHCGYGMAPYRNNKYRYYSCNLKNRSAKKCDNTSLNADRAEEIIVNKLMNITNDEIIENYNRYAKKFKIKLNNIEEIKKLNNKLIINEETMENLIKKLAFIDADLMNIITDEMKKIKEENENLKNRIEELKSANNEIDETKKNLNAVLDSFDNFKKFYNFSSDIEDRKELIKSVVKFVTWDSKTGNLDIILKYSGIEREDYPISHLSDRSFCPDVI